MSLLSDERKVFKFIEHDEPCSTELIIDYYLKCKRNDIPVPQKVIDHIDTCLSKIVSDRHHGFNPDFNQIFGFKNIVGRKKSAITNDNFILICGIKIENLMNDDGETYEDAVKKVANRKSVSEDVVKKAYTKYKKIPHSLDDFDRNGYSD